jgi:hypothetical protein
MFALSVQAAVVGGQHICCGDQHISCGGQHICCSPLLVGGDAACAGCGVLRLLMLVLVLRLMAVALEHGMARGTQQNSISNIPLKSPAEHEMKERKGRYFYDEPKIKCWQNRFKFGFLTCIELVYTLHLSGEQASPQLQVLVLKEIELTSAEVMQLCVSAPFP